MRNPEANERLRSWMTENGITQVTLAKRIGVSQASIAFYLLGNTTPRLDIQQKIADATEGAVPVSSWPVFKRVRVA